MNPRKLMLILVVGLATVSFAESKGPVDPSLASVEVPARTEARRPIPSEAEVTATQNIVRDIFKTEFDKAKKAKEFGAKRNLATQLLQQARESEQEPVTRYVCWLEARKLLENVGDVTEVMNTIDAISKKFAVDVVALKIESLEAAAARLPADLKALIDQALALADELRHQGKYENASRLFQTAHAAATKLKDRELAKQISEDKQELSEERKEFEDYVAAVGVLNKSPDDPDANLVTGKYLCLVVGDWESGGRNLIKGSDPELKALAEREQASPTTLPQVLALAEGWWDLAGKARGITKLRMQREAAYWYEVASFEATGLQKTGYAKRAQQVPGRSPRNPIRPGLLEVIFEGMDFEKQIYCQIQPSSDTNFDVGPAAPGLPVDGFSMIRVGKLKVPVTAKYTLFYSHDDGGRLWVDGKRVIDSWHSGVTHDQVDVHLSAGFHTLKLEYNELNHFAGLNLGWQSTDIKRQMIPSDALFHDPNVARARGVR